MKQYIELLNKILTEGSEKPDRTGTGTKSIFGHTMHFKMSEGFPLLTTKKMFLKGIIHELLWFLKGDTNIKYLQENGVHIWDEWADEDGALGPVYGEQWRTWTGTDTDYNLVVIDQISRVINQIKTTPSSRRMVVSAWNVAQLKDMALPPCHILFQFNVTGNKLSLALYQRSADVFLGVPFDIAEYALLLLMVAQITNLEPDEFIFMTGDTHLYLNHIEQAKLQASRAPFKLPKMTLNPEIKDIFDFKFEDFKLEEYQYHPAIKAEVSI